MPLSNRQKLEIIARAKKNGYKGDYLELFRMAEQQMRQDKPEVEFRGGGFANDINKPGKSTYVDARSGYGFPTTYSNGGPDQDLTPAITNVSNIYQSPEYLNRLKAEYKNAHGIDLSDQEALNIANTNIQSVQQGNPNALDFDQYQGPASIPSDAVGFKANPSQNVYLSTDPSMNDPYYEAVPGLGTPQGHTVKTTAQSAAEHEVAHRANTGPLSVMTSAAGNPLQPELAEYYSTFFTNAPENNPYNPNTNDNFSEYAQLPYEVKSQKKQLELALQDARIWNPSQGPFTQEHVEKLRNQRFNITGEGLDYMAQGLNLEDITTDYMSESLYRDRNSLYSTDRYDLSPSTQITRFTDYDSAGNVQEDQRYNFRPFRNDLNDYLLDPENLELPNSQGVQNRMSGYVGRYAADAGAYGRHDDTPFKTKDQGLRDEGFTTNSDQFQLDSFRKLQETKPRQAEAMEWISKNTLTKDNSKEWNKKYKLALNGVSHLKEIYRKDAAEQDERYKYNQRKEEKELEEQYKIDKEEFEKERELKEDNLIKFMNEVAMDDPFNDSNQVAKHGGFAAFFASDYDKYVQKKENGGEKGKPNTEISERDRYRNFLKREEAGTEYMKSIDSAIKKPDGTYYKAFEDGLYYPYIVKGENEATIGYGRKRANVLKDYAGGITEEQALKFMDEDIDNSLRLAQIYVEENKNSPMYGDVGSFGRLDSATQYMLADYPYNVGRLSKFPSFAKAVLTNDPIGAEKEYKRVKDKSTNEPLKRNIGFYKEYVQPFILGLNKTMTSYKNNISNQMQPSIKIKPQDM